MVKTTDLIYIGREYKNDILQCYLEANAPASSQNLSIENRTFFDLFEDQQNIIHYKNKSIRKVFCFIVKMIALLFHYFNSENYFVYLTNLKNGHEKT